MDMWWTGEVVVDVRQLFPFGQRAAVRVSGTGVSVFSARTDVFGLVFSSVIFFAYKKRIPDGSNFR